MTSSNYPKLPETFKRNWIADLRSGKFEQAREALCRENIGFKSYCCLGVACVTAGMEEIPDSFSFIPAIGKDAQNLFIKLPEAFRTDEGIALQEKLADFNDAQEMPFSEIADWIETHL